MLMFLLVFLFLRPSAWLASCWRARVRVGFDQYIIILNTLENRIFSLGE